MATIYQGVEQITCANGSNQADVYWWTTTSNDISLVSTVTSTTPKMGRAVADWSAPTAVNGPFFPVTGNNNSVNAFAINNSSWVIPGCTTNYEDQDNQSNPLDFLMDPVDKRSVTSLVFHGNGASFPLNTTDLYNNNITINLSDVNWGLGGMDLELSRNELDTDWATFSTKWKWGDNCMSIYNFPRTVIGYTGGGFSSTNYIIAVCESCSIFDIRLFLKSKGCNYIGLYLDGAASTSAKNNSTILIPSDRKIPVIISM